MKLPGIRGDELLDDPISHGTSLAVEPATKRRKCGSGERVEIVTSERILRGARSGVGPHYTIDWDKIGFS